MVNWKEGNSKPLTIGPEPEYLYESASFKVVAGGVNRFVGLALVAILVVRLSLPLPPG